VSHTHWDREWYRTFQAFRARLVDTVDAVLDLLDRDPGWSFVLDGQTIVVEDYLAIRPDQEDRLKEACRSGRLAIGPWYVQPDSLLPSGEAHVRNLLEGRRVGEQYGPVSRVAYTPDSFGHPAQFPQLFAGFGLDGFVYWRGNGDEIDTLPPVYRWVAPDGTSVVACHLSTGYFNAASLSSDPTAAVERLRTAGQEMLAAGATRLLFLNGVDHAPPDPNTELVANALSAATGWHLTRGRLEDYTEPAIVSQTAGDCFTGELVGARITNLLPGVWSSRLGLKLRNRRAETALVGWAEPWAALGRALGLADERPALRIAWRAFLANQAHDSIGGCSQDRVHEQMVARYDEAEELADETTTRILSRLAGLGTDRAVPWRDEVEVGVFNPSPHPRTDVVRFALDGHPFTAFTDTGQGVHPLALTSVFGGGVTVDGVPARVLLDDSPGRTRVIPEQHPWTVEWVAENVPALGWRRFRIARDAYSPDDVDEGREIAVPGIAVRANDDGTLTVEAADRCYEGLGAVEDDGDRGDTYDFDPVPGPIKLTSLVVTRHRHGSGIEELDIDRIFEVPSALAPDRKARSAERVPLRVSMRARIALGVDRVDLEVTVDNSARDHRLRLVFPTGAPGTGARAATTFDVVARPPRTASPSTWVQPAPRTFPHQGWVHNNGLTVAAPGLPEAEVSAEGLIYVTILRAVGWLSRLDLVSRPEPAGPGLETPGAQCLGEMTSNLSLCFGRVPQVESWDAELGLRAVPAGTDPLLPPGQSAFALEGRGLVLSALKPAERGVGLVARILNPTDAHSQATLRRNVPVGDVEQVRLDEEPTRAEELPRGIPETNALRVEVPPHALRSVLIHGPP
jgi:2-O-(6-phospho-alpha-D-mannosyl)-D-glycerate hydrolase